MSEKRMFEFVEGSSAKFWEIWRDGEEVRTRYGRIGSDGQTTVKSEGDEAKAQKLYDKLIKEKTGKGYVEKTAGAPAPTTAAAPAAAPAPKAPPKAAPAADDDGDDDDDGDNDDRGAAGGARRFEMDEKFWEITLDGASHTVRFGKIGTSGQAKTKDFDDAAAAKKDHDKLIKEKTGKGYVETAGAPAAPAASTSKKAKPALHPWLSSALGYRTADFDADDVYVFACRVNDDGDFAVHFSGTADEGDFICAGDALASGSEKIHLAQGGATFSQTVVPVDEATPAAAFPPFLLSRALFAALKSGTAIAWPTVLTGDGKTVPVTRTGAGTHSVKVNGKKQTVKTLLAKGDDVRLTILDDADWPFILIDDEADECGWWLKAVGNDLDADALHASDDEEDEEDEEDGDDEEEGGDDDDGGEGGTRRFEMDEKFWEITLDGASHTVRYGKIGTAGQAKTKDFDDEDAAKKDHDKLIKEKTGKGYEETEAEPASTKAPAAAPTPAPAPAVAKPAAAPAPAPAPAKPAPAPAVVADSGARRFEMDGKFWEISVDGASHTVRFGKVGAAGQEKTKGFDNEAAAQKDAEQLIKEKTGKGYEEVDRDG
jgi:predicted DNA-binding WGR domain protein